MNQKIAQWYLENLDILNQMYGKVRIYQDFSQIMIENFDLPPVFNNSFSTLLMLTPGKDIANHAAFQFFLDRDLKRVDGRSTSHLFTDNGEYNYLYQNGFSRLSFHLNHFKPTVDIWTGDNFMSICKGIYYFLGDEKGC